MSCGCGTMARDSIPGNVLKMIGKIKLDTAGKFSNELIHSFLKECRMDPNEATQKLLYLDSFHEVKRKSQNVNGGSYEDFRRGGMQWQGARGGQGNIRWRY